MFSKNNYLQLKKFLLNLNPQLRKCILIIIDIFCVVGAIYLAPWLSNENIAEITDSNLNWILSSSLIFGIPIYIFSGQYKQLTRFTDSNLFLKVLFRNLFLCSFLYFYGNIILNKIITLNYLCLVLLILTIVICIIKFILRYILSLNINKPHNNLTNAIIYGAGSVSTQIVGLFSTSNKYKIIGIIDDDPNLWFRTINQITIYPPHKLTSLKKKADLLFLSINSLKRVRAREIFENSRNLGFRVFRIPTLNDIITDKNSINDLKKINIEDILGRETIAPYKELLYEKIQNSVVCVTGGGGSIGSELCRQIIKLNPKKLIILENNEPSLYKIGMEINKLSTKNKSYKTVLGDVSDPIFLKKFFGEFKIDIVFHAAAYKHVPIVEENILSGLKNNILSTQSLCEISVKSKVKNFVFISTDKAVRPTNIMGASKRFAELIVQGFANDIKKKISKKNTSTCFSIVRFGNVLGSSGSVVPLFNRQIAMGGPITLTHEKVVRYFMTITEAAQLVIQSSALARGGDLFLLDMGEPIPIKFLAQQMIILAGFKEKNKEKPDGDIEIITTGLRKGEKLYEELLINAKSQKTRHNLIYRAIEDSLPFSQINKSVEDLKVLIKKSDLNSTLELLKKVVPEWEKGM